MLSTSTVLHETGLYGYIVHLSAVGCETSSSHCTPNCFVLRTPSMEREAKWPPKLPNLMLHCKPLLCCAWVGRPSG